MKYIIEPINDTDCRIIDIDCSDMQGKKVAELTIPATVEQDGKTWLVKEVGNAAPFANGQSDAAKFATLGKLKKLIISEGIERLGLMMGNDGSNAQSRGNAHILTEVALPTTLKVIGADAFRNCPNLTTCHIPDSVEEIGAGAFTDCSSLPYFQWPKSLKAVTITAFKGMMQPEGGFCLEIPDSIEKIDASWRDYFYQVDECKIAAKAWPVLDQSELCGFINSIDIPEGVRKVAGGFEKATRVSIPDSIEEIMTGRFGGYGRSENKIHCEVCASAETLKRVMAMPGALNHSLVKEITIPDGVSEVDVYDCPELIHLTLPASGLTSIRIEDCPALEIEELHVPDTVKELSVSNVPKLKVLSIPDSVEKVGNFENLTAKIEASPNVWSLLLSTAKLYDYHPEDKTLTIPEGVEKINEQCFMRSGLTTINFPASLREIGRHAFNGSKLKNVVLPEGLVKAEQYLFSEMSSLQTISFPASVTSYAFSDVPIVDKCPKLKYVVFNADSPSTAVYPRNLGKMVDWYVPDHMVEHVNYLKNTGKIKANVIMPLSKLSKGKTAAKKKSRSEAEVLSKPVNVEAGWYNVIYKFPVDEADLPMLKNDFDRLLVAMRYMRDKLEECSMTIELNSKMHFHIDNGEWIKVGTTMAVEEYPLPELPQYKKRLPEDSCDYLSVSAWLRFGYDFKVGEDELVDYKKVKLAKDKATKNEIPYGICYGKRFIPVSSIAEAGENIKVATENTLCNDRTFKKAWTREHQWLLKSAEHLPLLKELIESVNR